MPHQVWRVLSAYKGTLVTGSFWLAVVQNVMLMLRLSMEDMRSTEDLAIGNTILGSVQLVLCVVIFLLYAVQNGPLRQHEMWREVYKVSHEEAHLRARAAFARIFAAAARLTCCGGQAAPMRGAAYDADPMTRRVAAWMEQSGLREIVSIGRR